VSEQIPVIYHNKINKIKLFDILVDDIHSMGEDSKPHALDDTVALTYHEVWEWISTGGDWYFKVIEHNNPENVFMNGTTYQDMNSARKGEEELLLASVTEAEISDIEKIIKRKRRKEYGLE
jgi:hypothetical protein